MTAEWAFLVDENLEKDLARAIQQEGFIAEHVSDALGAGADDVADILPYATREDMLLITNDRDFAGLPHNAHPGILLLYDTDVQPHEVASGVVALVDAYDDRDQLRHREALDDWV